MSGQRRPHPVRRIRPFHARVEPFRILPEHNDVDVRLLVAAVNFLANEVQRIPGKRNAGADASIKIELLAHGHDRTEVRVTLGPQLWLQFPVGFFLRLRSDRAEQAEFVVREQVYGALRQGIALVHPALPADIGMDVLGIESNRIQHAQCLGQNLVPDPIAGHADHRVFRHECDSP